MVCPASCVVTVRLVGSTTQMAATPTSRYSPTFFTQLGHGVTRRDDFYSDVGREPEEPGPEPLRRQALGTHERDVRTAYCVRVVPQQEASRLREELPEPVRLHVLPEG